MEYAPDHPTRAVAYHEAGHAVIGRVLGLICGDVTIIPNEEENEAGHSICGDPWATVSYLEKAFMEKVEAGVVSPKYREVRSVFRARIIAFMAGAETENVVFGSCKGGDGDDRYHIDLMATSEADFEDDSWRRFESRMRRQTRRLIRKHRDKIERVAKALLERRKLEGKEVDALMKHP